MTSPFAIPTAATPPIAAAAGMAVLLAGAVCAPQAGAADFRLQIGGGYAFSALEEDVSEPVESTSLSATLEKIDTGNGPAAGAAVWIDGWAGENVSFGLEYLYTSLDPSATIRLSTGQGASQDFSLEADGQLHTAFVNAAWRKRAGAWHPYAGAGLGFGFVDLKLRNDLIDGSVSGPHAGVQAFVGVDYDLTENLYAGANARAYYVDGRIVDLDVQFLTLQVMGVIGLKF